MSLDTGLAKLNGIIAELQYYGVCHSDTLAFKDFRLRLSGIAKELVSI